MNRSRQNNRTSTWRFRREVTFGNLLHLAVLTVMAVTAWTNLQKELALIQHDLNQLVTDNRTLHLHIEHVSDLCRDHEYRLMTLETRKEWTGPASANMDLPTPMVGQGPPYQK